MLLCAKWQSVWVCVNRTMWERVFFTFNYFLFHVYSFVQFNSVWQLILKLSRERSSIKYSSMFDCDRPPVQPLQSLSRLLLRKNTEKLQKKCYFCVITLSFLMTVEAVSQAPNLSLHHEAQASYTPALYAIVIRQRVILALLSLSRIRREK